MSSARRLARACVAVAVVAAAAPAAHAAVVIDPATHAVTTPRFSLQFDTDNVEQLTTLHWAGAGSADLAAEGGSWGGGCTDVKETWGQAYADDGTVAEVGAGSRGTWAAAGDDGVQIDSQIAAASPCQPGWTGRHPVHTTYRFFDGGPRQDQIAVARRIDFGPEPTYVMRPYVTRMPKDVYDKVLFDANDVVNEGSPCADGCTAGPWVGIWYALHSDADGGKGMLVVRNTWGQSTSLLMDVDALSGSNSTSGQMFSPGWIGAVTELEYLCFYDATTWPAADRTPSQPVKLPSWCGPPALTITGATVSESAGTATLTVTRSYTDGPTPRFDVWTWDGTARGGHDYGTATVGTFAPGAASTTVTVPIVDDAVHEDTETFEVLFDPNRLTNATAGEPTTVTITDDDAAPPQTTTTQTTTTTTPPVTGESPPPKLPPPPTKPSVVKATDYITLPSARSCVPRSRLRIRLKQPKGIAIASATIKVDNKVVKTIKGRRVTAPVDLRGLPKGRFTVSIAVTTTTGTVVKQTRTYRTCAPKRRR